MSEYLSKGANINSVVRLFTRKTTALLEAIKLNDLELIRFLLDHGADPNIEADDGPSGETPSQVATRSDNAEIQIMVQRAADYLAYARQHAAIASAVPPSIQEMTAPVEHETSRGDSESLAIPEQIFLPAAADTSSHDCASSMQPYMLRDPASRPALVADGIEEQNRAAPWEGTASSPQNSTITPISESNELCVVCGDCPSAVGLVHAQEKRIHRCCCEKCAEELVQRGMPCPICRSPFEVMKIY